MPSTRPLNYTTKIPAAQTIGECQALLAAAGASAVAVEYDSGAATGLAFRLDTPHGKRNFDLPVRVGEMHAVLQKAKREGAFASVHVSRAVMDRYMTREHAAAVAWRVVRDWLEATLALIAAGMAGLDETMLPYLRMNDDQTLYQAYQAREQALELAAGTDG